MSLSIGIIGLPNVGKSTIFNALVQEQAAQVANYPFCTIEPNKSIVPVPDSRLEKLASLVNVGRKIHATIQFVDVAGLVKGASQGEGLGNQFLGHIRDVDAVLHVVRCFDDPNVVHINALPSPIEDIEIINTELALADYQQLEARIEKLSRQVKGDKNLIPVMEMARRLLEVLAAGNPLWGFEGRTDPAFQELNQELRFLTAKPVIFIGNVDEEGLVSESSFEAELREYASDKQVEYLTICARLEEDIIDFSPEERNEYLEISGIKQRGLDKILRKSYQMLGLISYFSFNEDEVRAWTIPDGWSAPQAAGQIHTDFERGFIKADVATFENFEEHGSWTALKSIGQLRSEGREYVVQDGDVIYYRFNL
ncbi:MAG: redox-regulated ATPase YchF [Chloroflexota bacterium]